MESRRARPQTVKRGRLNRSPKPLLRPGAAGDHREGADEDLQIEPDAPVLDVSRVQRDVAVKRRVLPRLYLPQASHPRQHVETPQMAQIVPLHFAGDGGRGPTMLIRFVTRRDWNFAVGETPPSIFSRLSLPREPVSRKGFA